MKKCLPLPTASVLSERLNYDPETGKLFWKHSARHHFKTDGAWKRFNNRKAGGEAGHKHRQKNGDPHAVVIRLNLYGKDMWLLAHRIIHRLMGVEIPEGMEVDHRNRNPWDNRWENLRIATQSQNLCNTDSRRVGADGKPRSLPKGVSIQLGRYKAQIVLNGKKRHIGMYSTPEEAAAAYRGKAESSHGEFFCQESGLSETTTGI